MARRYSSDVEAAISNAARRWNIPVPVMRAFAGIESSGNPRNSTGSYHGLFQLSQQEFRRGGGSGSIFDPHQNAQAAGRLLAGHRVELAKALGREPTWNELYLSHQQGMGGLQAHMQNPQQLAWQSMASTPEGRQKDAKGPIYRLPNGEMGLWSQAAVARNIPSQSGLRWDTATSGDFIQAWDARLSRSGVPTMSQDLQTALADIDAATPDPQPNPPGQPRDLSALSAAELTRMAGPKQSPWEMAGGSVPSVSEAAAATSAPIVQSTTPTGTMGDVFSGFNAKGFGGALSAAGKTLMGSGIKIPEMANPATQMAALDSGAQWPSIPPRPQRRPPGRGQS